MKYKSKLQEDTGIYEIEHYYQDEYDFDMVCIRNINTNKYKNFESEFFKEVFYAVE